MLITLVPDILAPLTIFLIGILSGIYLVIILDGRHFAIWRTRTIFKFLLFKYNLTFKTRHFYYSLTFYNMAAVFKLQPNF